MNMTELSARDMRKVNMKTCSQANLEKCPDRKTFAEHVWKAFDFEKSMIKPMYWAVCREAHQNGGNHHHMCIKFKKNKRWGSVKWNFLENGEIDNFTEGRIITSLYFGILTKVTLKYCWVTPTLIKTSKASEARSSCERNSDVLSTTQTKQNKSQHLSEKDTMEIIKSKNISNKNWFENIISAYNFTIKSITRSLIILKKTRKIANDFFNKYRFVHTFQWTSSKCLTNVK